MAGAWSRTAVESGTARAPGNVVLEGVLDVAQPLRGSQIDRLTSVGINPVRMLPGWGARIWGVRTLSTDPELVRIPTVRLLGALTSRIPLRVRGFLARHIRSVPDYAVLAGELATLVGEESGLPQEAFQVQVGTSRSGAVEVTLWLTAAVTRGKPAGFTCHLPHGRWTSLRAGT